MKNLTNQFIACFLLLCFSVTIVPLSFIHEHSHEHSEEIHCNINDEIHSDDACHFSLYHNEKYIGVNINKEKLYLLIKNLNLNKL